MFSCHDIRITCAFFRVFFSSCGSQHMWFSGHMVLKSIPHIMWFSGHLVLRICGFQDVIFQDMWFSGHEVLGTFCSQNIWFSGLLVSQGMWFAG